MELFRLFENLRNNDDKELALRELLIAMTGIENAEYSVENQIDELSQSNKHSLSGTKDGQDVSLSFRCLEHDSEKEYEYMYTENIDENTRVVYTINENDYSSGCTFARIERMDEDTIIVFSTEIPGTFYPVFFEHDTDKLLRLSPILSADMENMELEVAKVFSNGNRVLLNNNYIPQFAFETLGISMENEKEEKNSIYYDLDKDPLSKNAKHLLKRMNDYWKGGDIRVPFEMSVEDLEAIYKELHGIKFNEGKTLKDIKRAIDINAEREA